MIHIKRKAFVYYIGHPLQCSTLIEQAEAFSRNVTVPLLSRTSFSVHAGSTLFYFFSPTQISARAEV